MKVSHKGGASLAVFTCDMGGIKQGKLINLKPMPKFWHVAKRSYKVDASSRGRRGFNEVLTLS